MPESAPGDPLADLRERIDAARRAARRVAQDLHGADERSTQEAQALAALLALARGLVSPEREGQLRDLVRQVLLLLQALIDRSLQALAEQTDDGPVMPDTDLP
jgi:hypothetical protein